MIPTPEETWALLCEYNQGEFHRKHSRIVGDVLRWFAEELGYGSEADFWNLSVSFTTWTLSSGRISTALRSRNFCVSERSMNGSSMRWQVTATS